MWMERILRMYALFLVNRSLACSEDAGAAKVKIETGLLANRNIIDTFIWYCVEGKIQMHQKFAILVLLSEYDKDSEIWARRIRYIEHRLW